MRRCSSLGSSIYPSSTSRGNKRIGITPFKRCVQCGMPNDTRLTGWSKMGDGLVVENSTTGEQKVIGGCMFCGSYKWQKYKPRKLPDDRYLPNPELKKR